MKFRGHTITIYLILIFAFCMNMIDGKNKYTEEANQIRNYHDLKDPLRMGKLNMLWEKARKQLSEPKLKKLYSELKVQDTQELTLKKLKASGGDKEGLKEAEVRRKLSEIARAYGLEKSSSYEDAHVEHKIKKVAFNDKKLNKLWFKAEQSGLTEKELKTLMEEFQHHQDKIDEYHMLLNEAGTLDNEIPSANDVHQFNEVSGVEGSSKDFVDNVNSIRVKHRELKDDYKSLHKKATKVSESHDFENPKVAGLWNLALRSDFDEKELESLHSELKHYEARLSKLTYLDNELNKIGIDKFNDEELSDEDREKILRSRDTEGKKILEDRLNKQIRKTDKMHEHLEMRILSRHNEL